MRVRIPAGWLALPRQGGRRRFRCLTSGLAAFARVARVTIPHAPGPGTLAQINVESI